MNLCKYPNCGNQAHSVDLWGTVIWFNSCKHHIDHPPATPHGDRKKKQRGYSKFYANGSYKNK